MPTFLILKGSSVKETVRGANAAALRTAVLSAAADAAKGPARSSASFTGSGQTLGASPSAGGGGAASRPVAAGLPSVDVGAILSSPGQYAQGRGLLQTIVRFLGLYFQTLFSLDPIKTAEESPFAVKTYGGAKVR